MKYFEIYKKALILTFILINLLSIPLIAYSYNLNVDKNVATNVNLDYDYLTKLISTDQDEINIDSNYNNNKEVTIFDESLTEFLLNYSLGYESASDRVKVIILFKEGIAKEDRINIIDNIFEFYEIISNYNIISGVYLICKSAELISKQEILNGVTEISKICKSQFYKNPDYSDGIPNSSSLNANDYPNWWIPAIGADDLTYDGTGVRVAVVDTGIYEHPDLNIVANESFVTGDLFNSNDDYGHGTHAAGLIGSTGISSSGKYRGVAPGVSLINARAGNFTGLSDGDIIAAIQWAVKPELSGGPGADIISMSFGGGLPDFNDAMTLTISKVANDYGVILVSSAGNSGPDYLTGGSPASGNDVIAVGATDKNNYLASFTSWGPTLTYLGYPDVVAPGVNVISTEAPGSVISDEKRYIGDYFDFPDDGDYIPLSGTSMACPIVAGALAILKEAYPSITPETARIALLEGAKPLSNYDSDDTLKFGAGLINVSASLEYLDSISLDVNDTAKFFPDIIPLKPFDLLNFPGDAQSFNITVISGKANSYDVNIPNKINGLKLDLDHTTLTFSEENVKFLILDIEIEQGANPGIRSFEMNLTIGANVYDSIIITIDIKFPEYKVLMESYHGLNDWFPEISFYQMDFYAFMKDLTELNISVDYSAQYWTPYYNVDYDNSLLTEERLAQYDLIVLQNPILPYTLEEMKNLNSYFENGGNILFLGTRYQDLCIDNINTLFSILGSDITINEENVYNENWLGIGASINSQSVTDLSVSPIFNGVDKFQWNYGNTFDVGVKSESIASLDGNTVVATYNETNLGGKLVAFGDLYWASEFYTSTNYQLDHAKLAQNLMDYFFSADDISIQIGLDSERTANAQINLSIYIKDKELGKPIDSSILNTNLSIIISNTGYFETITTTSIEDGIAYNTTFSLPSTNYSPYTISLNFTLGSTIYQKNSKILYYNPASMPSINSLDVSSSPVYRELGDSTWLLADLDNTLYDVNAYLSIYSYSFYNTKKTVNKTFSMTYNMPFSAYRYDFDPSLSDPSGVAIFYIISKNTATNYTNPYSPRFPFEVRNNPPTFIESSSFITIDGQTTFAFDETYEGESSYLIPVSQGSSLDFSVAAADSVSYEDINSANMRISVNLFIVSTTVDGYINIIYPRSLPLKELSYQSGTNSHQGTFVIPYTIAYNSISGIKYISTATNYDTSTDEGYLAILLITLIDSEGGSEDFLILLSIRASLQLDLVLILIIVGLIIGIGAIVIITLVVKSRRSKRSAESSEYYPQDYYTTPEQDTTYETQPSGSQGYRIGFYCPYCGYNIGSPKNFCPNCGKTLYFE